MISLKKPKLLSCSTSVSLKPISSMRLAPMTVETLRVRSPRKGSGVPSPRRRLKASAGESVFPPSRLKAVRKEGTSVTSRSLPMTRSPSSVSSR